MSENLDEVTKNDKKEIGSGAAKKAANGAKNAAKTAQKLKKAGMAIKLIAALWWVALIVVSIFLIIGIYSFIITLPGMMLDKIAETVGGLWDNLCAIFVGNETYIKDNDQYELSKYINNMGYDVVGYGFASPNDIKKNEETGEEEITSKYLKAYLLADFNTYTVENGGFFKNLVDATREFFGEKELLRGMLRFEQDDTDWSITDVSIDRKAKTVSFKVYNPGLTNWFNSDTYTYDLDGWAGRYGKPLEFLLTLHVSTMAPDLAYKIASDDELNTKVHIGYEAVDAWVTTKYIVKEETIENLKKLDKDDDTKKKVIWNIEGLEDLKKKIGDDGKLELDKEDLEKIKKILDTEADEYETEKIALTLINDWTTYFKQLKNQFEEGTVCDKNEYGATALSGISYNLGNWYSYKPINSDYDGLLAPTAICNLTYDMNDAIEKAEEDGKTIKFNKEPEYYEKAANEMEQLYFPDIVSEEDELNQKMDEEGEKFNKKDVVKIMPKTVAQIDQIIELLEEIYKNAAGYEDEDGNHVDGDLEILNKNTEEAQKTRNELENALLEIGLTEAAINEAEKMNKPKDGTEIKAVVPRIKYVSKAWYRNIYFVINDNVLDDSDIEDDEFIKQLKEKKKQKQNIEFDAYSISSNTKVTLPDYVFEPGEGTSQEDMKGIDGKGEFIIKEMRNSSTVQTEQPKKGAVNKHTKELFVGSGNDDKTGKNPKPQYYIYDGSKETAKEIEELKKKVKENGLKESEIDSIDTKDVYREIDINKNSLAAFSILENMKTQDADFILRDFKDLLVELKYFKKSDFEEKDTGILDWIIPDYEPAQWPISQYEKKNYNYGTLMISKKTTDEIKKDEMKFNPDTNKFEEYTEEEKEEKKKNKYKDNGNNSGSDNGGTDNRGGGAGDTKTVESLDGVIMIGDSWTVGLQGLSSVKNSGLKTLAESGAGAKYWLDNFDKISSQDPKGVIVYLGLNWTTYSDDMENLLIKIKQTFTNVPIYVLKVPNVAKSVNNEMNPDEWNNQIKERNNKIQSFCQSNGMYFIDTTQGLIGSDGYLSDEYASGGGYHLTTEGYELFFKNIQSKVVNSGGLKKSSSNMALKKSSEESNCSVKITQESGFGYDEIVEVDGVQYKHYTQSHPDVSQHPFDAGRIGNYGCGPTSVAIVISGYGSEKDSIWTADNIQSRSLEAMRDLIKQETGVGGTVYGRKSTEETIKDVRQALSEGKPVPAHIVRASNDPRTVPVYTGKGHFVVLVSEDSHGLHIINPSSCNPQINVDPEGLEGFVRDYMTSYMILDEAPDGNRSMNGFEAGSKVITPGIGVVTKKDDKSIEIKFTPNNIVKDMTIKITGFDVNDDIKVGDKLELEQEIGVTTEENIDILMKTSKKAVVENVEDYMPPPVPENAGNTQISLGDDYCIDLDVDDSNVIRNVDDFKRIFADHQNIVDNAEAFIQYQEEYKINAVYAACVTIIESGGGENWNAIASWTYNWFSIVGKYNGKTYRNPNSSNPRTWRVYPDFATAISDFCDLMRNGSYYIKVGKNTVKQIAPTYCDEKWGESVVKEMTNRLQKL